MEELDREDFKPKGTIVFMLLLLVLTVVIWLGVYNLQIERHL